MLRIAALQSTLEAINPSLTEPVTAHMKQVVLGTMQHANEAARLSQRQSVTVQDVAQAADLFQTGTETAAAAGDHHEDDDVSLVGGALPDYDGYCAGQTGQCGVLRHATCMLSGGGGRFKNKKEQRRHRCQHHHRKALSNSCRLTNSGHRHSHRHAAGGVFSYTGFCDGHPSQCAWADSLSGSVDAQSLCGAGRSHKRKTRQNRTRRATHRQSNGGNPNADYCGGNRSQCGWTDDLNGETDSCGRVGGHHLRTTLLTKRQRGGNGAQGSSAPRFRFVNQKAVGRHMSNMYKMNWSAAALQKLQHVADSHLRAAVRGAV